MAFCANDCTPGGVHSLSFTSFIIMGMYPLFISNGTSPVVLLETPDAAPVAEWWMHKL
jgi:hypothetical protein